MKKYISLLCVSYFMLATIILSCEYVTNNVGEYKTIYCSFGDAKKIINCEGTLTDINSSVVDVDHPAYFSKVYAKEGDRVSAGDIIAVIDIERTVLLLERIDSETITELFLSLGISNALQSALVGEIPELSKYRSTIEQLLNSDGKIRSPRDGIITDISFSEGELLLSPSKAVIADRSTMGINAYVKAEHSSNIICGMKANVKSDCFSDLIEASVVNISPNVTSDGYVKIILELSNASNALKSGFPVTVNIVADNVENALMLPFESIFEVTDDIGYVFVRNGDRVSKKEVFLGVRTIDKTQIVSGLTGREEIVITDGKNLTDGQYARFLSED